MASKDEEQMFLTCEICNLPFTNIKTFKQHMQGKKHKKEVRGHKRAKEVESVDEDLCLEEGKDSDTQDYTCNICEKDFTGIIPYTQHLNSKQHAKNVRKKKAEDDSVLLEDDGSASELPDNADADLNEMLKTILPEPYGSCSICKKLFTGPESYSLHMKSKTHEKRKSERKLLKKLKAVLNFCEAGDSEEICKEGEKVRVYDDTEEKQTGQEKLKCKVCDKVFNTSVLFGRHLASKTHVKKERQNKLLNELEAIKTLELEDDSSSSDDEESFKVLICEVCSVLLPGPENLKAHLKSKKHKKAVEWQKYRAKKYKSVENGSIAPTSLENKSNPEKLPVTEKETEYQSAAGSSKAEITVENKSNAEKLPVTEKETEYQSPADSSKAGTIVKNKDNPEKLPVTEKEIEYQSAADSSKADTIPDDEDDE